MQFLEFGEPGIKLLSDCVAIERPYTPKKEGAKQAVAAKEKGISLPGRAIVADRAYDNGDAARGARYHFQTFKSRRR
jgi:hypothetical protein